jgi:hypothetical protein
MVRKYFARDNMCVSLRYATYILNIFRWGDINVMQRNFYNKMISWTERQFCGPINVVRDTTYETGFTYSGTINKQQAISDWRLATDVALQRSLHINAVHAGATAISLFKAPTAPWYAIRVKSNIYALWPSGICCYWLLLALKHCVHIIPTSRWKFCVRNARKEAVFALTFLTKTPYPSHKFIYGT